MDPAWIAALAAAIGTAAGLAGWAIRSAWRFIRKILGFLEDWSGEAARPADGVPARPGVLLRLASVESLTAELAREMRPNHGTSLRDVVHQTAAGVADVKAEQGAARDRMSALEDRLAGKDNGL